MAYDDERLNRIFDRTDGFCHLCCKRLCFTNYARYGARGAWEVEHSVPRSRGGTDHLNNLYPACIGCNRSKAARSSKSARASYGRSRAPHSGKRKEQIRSSNATKCGVVGSLLGCVAGPWGAVIGAGVGAKIGRGIDPNG